jgi:uncharacterized damage-inducible protein DinB
MNAPVAQGEREGLLAFLEHQRQAVRNATYGLSDDQARLRPTPSELSLGGIVTHLAYGERGWTDRAQGTPLGDTALEDYMASFRLPEGTTLAAALREYEQAGERTDATIAGIDDLGQRVPLPAAPWFPDPERCTVRWVLLHLIEETARHAGHADVLREALDGAFPGGCHESSRL